MNYKWIALRVTVALLFAIIIVSPAIAATYDNARPINPPNRPVVQKPFIDSAVNQVAGPGDGSHSDDPTRTIKGYNAYDFALADSDGKYQSFDVYSSAPGKVVYMTDTGYSRGTQEGCPVDVDPATPGYQGQGIFIDHGNGWQTFYFHLATISVANGATIDSAGIKIGTAGCTGTGVIHLHYDLRWYDSGTKKTWTYPVEFAYTPPSLESFPLDLVFVIDTTGSMGDDIAAVKVAANEIVDIVKDATSNSRIALVDFRDYPSRTGASYDYPYRDALRFTYSGDGAKSAINSLTLGYGGDGPETQYCALMHTMYGDNCGGSWTKTSIGTWRAIPNKFIIYLTDAPPLSPEPFTGYTGSYVKGKANQGGFELWGGDSGMGEGEPATGLSIFPIIVGGDPTALQYALELADGTGGKVFTAASAADVAKAVLDAVKEIVTPPTPPPSCDSASPNIGLLWPPNNKFVSVNIFNIENADSITIISVFQDEPVGSDIDANNMSTNTVNLRAQRDGTGDGRVYHIVFSATGVGGTCQGEVKVIVPHDLGKGQGARGTAGDGGALFNSTTH
jgi:murein DD-endopeptidase MepM/ murein hydrolase activator NlpD